MRHIAPVGGMSGHRKAGAALPSLHVGFGLLRDLEQICEPTAGVGANGAIFGVAQLRRADILRQQSAQILIIRCIHHHVHDHYLLTSDSFRVAPIRRLGTGGM